VVEVPAYGGRRQLQAVAQVCRRGRPTDQDRPHDALARRLVAGGAGLVFEFHNNSVPLMV
jgi:hypothetical protein